MRTGDRAQHATAAPEIRRGRVPAVAITLAALVLVGAACGGDDRGNGGDDAAADVTMGTGTAGTNGAPDATGVRGGSEGSGGGLERDERRGAPGSSRAGGSPAPAEPGDRYVPEHRDHTIRGDGSIERFGRSASETEAEEVVAAAIGYYDARAARSWERACDLMSGEVGRQLFQLAVGSSGLKEKDCPAVMEALAQGVPRQALVAEARGIRFNEVRIEGNRAFAIFKGGPVAHGTMPMVREDGQWKVDALVAASL